MSASKQSQNETGAQLQKRLRQLAEEVVRPSFRWCCDDGDDFFDDFYATLSERAPGIGAMFAHVDMQEQNRLIRRGVEHLIDFAQGSAESAGELRRIARTHGRQGLNIAPELYSLWIDTLMETVRAHDPEADDNAEAAWRVVLRGGIDLIISLY
ncbi:globin [bacterium]|nr:globin [bacterium]